MKKYSGWTSSLGESGKMLQDVFTIVLSGIMVLAMAIMVIQAIKAGTMRGKADGPEERKEANVKFFSILVGIAIIILAGILPIVLWNTIGKFSVVDITAKTKPSSSLANLRLLIV